MSWRVGKKVGRTIYDGDVLIGMMDTPELAALVVAAMQKRDALCCLREISDPCPFHGLEKGRDE